MKNDNKEQFFANELKMSYHLLSPKSKKPARIYMLVRLDGKQYKLPIGVKVYPKQWNDAIQKAYISEILTPLDNYNNRIANTRINECTILYNDFKYYLCNTIERNNPINILRNKIYHSMAKRSKYKNPILFIKTAIDKKYGERKGSTSTTFLSNLTSIERYCKENSIVLTSIQDIDYNFLNNYRDWACQRPSRQYKQHGFNTDLSSINHSITNIKTMLKYMEEIGEYDMAKAQIDKIEKYPLKLKSYEDMIALTETEIEALKNLNLEKESDRKTRDVFLFTCYVGQRVSDIKAFNEKANLVEVDGKQYFKLRQQKVQSSFVTIPILPEAREILTRINWDVSYPYKSEMYVGKKIKKYCEMIGLTGDEICFHEDIKGIHTFKKKRCEIVATHTARRTFATIAYKRGVDIETISKITGQDIKTLKMYLRITGEENADMFTSAWNTKTDKETPQSTTMQNIISNMNELLEQKKDVLKEQIEEDKKALAMLGASALEIADANTIDDIQQLICKYQQPFTDMGVDPYLIKAIFHNSQYTTITEKRKQLEEIIKDLME